MPDRAADAYPPPGDIWREWRPGMRVVVRYRTHARPPLTDALGEVVSIDGGHVEIATRRGVVKVTLSDVVAGKLVPPPPKPRT